MGPFTKFVVMLLMVISYIESLSVKALGSL